MTLVFRIRTVAAFLFVAVFSLFATAQTPAQNTTEWESEPLKLRLFYPSDLVKADTERLMLDDSGIHAVATQLKHPEIVRCLHPVLLLMLPQSGPPQTAKTQPASDSGTQIPITSVIVATLRLAELDINCLNAENTNTSTTLLKDMAEVLTDVPTMRSIVQPSTYTIGWQKVYMAAAQRVQIEGASPTQSQFYAMGISTNWNSHLLVWYFSSNSIETLNRITKTTVRFGSAQAAPLYPLTIGNATP
jgi:hypothetical protein